MSVMRSFIKKVSGIENRVSSILKLEFDFFDLFGVFDVEVSDGCAT